MFYIWPAALLSLLKSSPQKMMNDRHSAAPLDTASGMDQSAMMQGRTLASQADIQGPCATGA